MKGRPEKAFATIMRPIYFQTPDKKRVFLKDIQIRCPICGSDRVSTNGTQKRKSGYVETFICRNNKCEHLKYNKSGKQFVLTSSYYFKKILNSILHDIISDLMAKNASKSFIAEKYGISPSIITYISKKITKFIETRGYTSKLVSQLQEDTAIAIDETFLKINGKSIYIIIATGYSSQKTLGLLVSERRIEGEIRKVFDEADQNTIKGIKIVTADAWGATQRMVKNLKRPITLIIHKHKKPYDRAVIKRYEYKNNKRFITEIGIKTDFFKKRKKREYFLRESSESLVKKAKKKRGRPKGVKNGQGRKKVKQRSKKKRGRKGLFRIFSIGKRKYAKIDPHRESVRLSKQCSMSVQRAMQDAMSLFSLMYVQNNIAEVINSILRLHFRFSGPKDIAGIELELRSFMILRNNPALLEVMDIDYLPHGTLFNWRSNLSNIIPILEVC